MKTERFNKLTEKEKKELYKKDYERQKKSTKTYSLKLSFSTNYRAIKKLEEQESVSSYLKGLIENDMTDEEKARYDKWQEQELAKIREQRLNSK